MASRRDPAALVTLRVAAEPDLDEIVAIERLAFSDPWSRDAFAALLHNDAVRFTVAERQFGAIRGLAGYSVAWFVVEQAEIANLAVAPSARRHGVGARLLDDMIAHATERGSDVLFLEVRDSNVAARGLYQSRGFRQVGRRRNYYRHPVEDALVLRRDVVRLAR